MFDLFRSRTRTTRIVLGAILVFVAFTMVVTLIPWGGGYGGFGGDSNIVASIGDEDLTQNEVDRQIRSAMRNRSFPRELANIFVPQLIDQMITERAMAFEAERIGFRVTSEDVNQTIASMLPQLYQGPQEVRDRAYADFLARRADE